MSTVSIYEKGDGTMTEKVELPKEVADAIESVRKDYGDEADEKILTVAFDPSDRWVGGLSVALNEFDRSTLIRALVNGYTVKRTAAEKVAGVLRTASRTHEKKQRTSSARNQENHRNPRRRISGVGGRVGRKAGRRMINEKRLTEIEARLAVATPGPWTYYNPRMYSDSRVKQGDHDLDGKTVSSDIEREADGRLIANAQTDLADLCAALRETRLNRDVIARQAEISAKAADRLQAENERLRAALREIADMPDLVEVYEPIYDVAKEALGNGG